ncbi:MAG: hypothetical protein M0Q42_04485 [Xanthomonadales bacterium]|nr:hypothetical protein [Xanthomonadales bacterium]
MDCPGRGHEYHGHGCTVTGDLDASQRERLVQIANACPVHKLLAGDIRIDTALAQD